MTTTRAPLRARIFGLFAHIVVFGLVAAPTWGATLLGYWNLNEGTGTTAADTSGSRNSGTLVNSPSWVAGEAGNALDFIYNGKAYVSVPGAGNLANLYKTGMTVTAWIKPRSGGGNDLGRIVNKDNNDVGWFLSMNGSNTLRFEVNKLPLPVPYRLSKSAIVLNKWQHVAATWDGSTNAANIHIYINGVLADSTTYAGSGVAADDSASPLIIGNRPDAARSFDGGIDEVRVYSGMLSAADIAALAAGSTAPPATGWSGGDIGSVGAAGSSTSSGSTFTVKGSGVDIYGAADSFQFDSQSFTGDGSITARVVSQTNTNVWAKAGVMFRETLSPDSKFALAAVATVSGSVYEARTSAGAAAISVHGPVVKDPYWVRLARVGNILTGYVSPDGKTWTSLSSSTVAMGATVRAGLAVTSHAQGTISTAVFDNVTLTTGSSTVPSVSVAPTVTSLTVGGSRQFTATVSNGTPVTWAVDGVVGGNGTVGSISANGFYTAGTAVGTHNIVVTSAAHTTQSASAIAAVTDLTGVYTFHNDLSRDGANTREYALTTSNVNTAHFGKIAACTADGAIHGQPLWAANLTVNGVLRNVVFVATQHDGLFAFDADASPCLKLWSANLIDSGHGGTSGETPVPCNLLGVGDCDIQPEVGVTSTPVIDPSTGILYVVSKSVNSAHTAYFQRLHAIDFLTGREKPNSPVTIAGTFPGTGSGGSTVSFDARQEQQRAGLALVNGIVYIAWAAHEDAAPWYGWMMGYQYNGTFTQKSIVNFAPNTQKAGVWMSGGAPAVDSSGKLYVITGNATFDATSPTAPNNDYGDSLLQLTPALKVTQWFTPSDELTDDQNDKDFGSGGAAILADLPAGNTVTHALICGGKDHELFVLNRDLLGGFGDGAAVQRMDFGHAIFATGAFWNNNYYLAGLNGPLQALHLNTATVQFSTASSSTHTYGFPGATPSISSAATRNGIVWTLDTLLFCTHDSKGCGPAVLYAHDASNLSTELWNSSLVASDAAGHGIKFSVPTVANGKVYVGTRGNNAGGAASSTSIPGELDIYGLKP